MLTKQKVQHIAKLARLGLTKNEVKKFQKELESILDYVSELKELAVTEVEPMSHPFSLENVMRQDEVITVDLEQTKKTIAQAPQKEKGYIKVKAVL